jgi:hypothetical protein
VAYTFPMEKQQEPDWCWAAVAVSVEYYFDPQSTWTQAALAQAVLEQRRQIPAGTDCSKGGCDIPWYLSDALTAVGKLRATLPGRILSYQEIQQELIADRPVCARISWQGGGAHFVVISGYGFSPGGIPQLYVSDPLLQDSSVAISSYDDFVSAYFGDGQWEETYLTQQGGAPKP